MRTSPAVDIERVLQLLRTPAMLPVRSDRDMASKVKVIAEKKRLPEGTFSYLKAPEPVAVGWSPLRTSPADILRELGVATTFVSRSRFLPVAQLWAHVRYCAAMRTGRNQMLELSRDAAQQVVHHHKVAQSEQLGIGLALVVARKVLRELHPRLDYHVVDADVALKVGDLASLPGEVRNQPSTRKRPDYFLVGFERGAPGAVVHVAVLECKGTHLEMREVRKQLGDACHQVQTVTVGGRPLYGLMVASHLRSTGIRSYVFDPPGDDELWSGDPEELRGLLEHRPNDGSWRAAAEARASNSDGSAASGTSAEQDQDQDEAQGLGISPPYPIPGRERGWFTQVLSSTTAAAMLAFAGNISDAKDYTTDQQLDMEQEPLADFDAWSNATTDRIRFPQSSVSLLGQTQRMSMGDGRTLAVFRGLESRLYRDLSEGRLGRYIQNAGRLRRWWTAQPQRRAPGNAFSVGDDGSVLVMRVEND